MKRSAWFLLLFFLVIPLFGQTVDEATVTMLRARAESFVELVNDGEYQAAFDLVRSSPVAISAELLDSLQETANTQLEGIAEVYGEKLGVRYVGYRAVSDFLLQFVFVSRYEWHFVSWKIIFYRGAEGQWLFSSISYDDDVEALLSLDL